MVAFKGNRKIWIFEHNNIILKWNRIIINLVSFIVLGLMIARYGLNFEAKTSSLWIPTIRVFYSIYAFNYLFRVFLERKKVEFIKSRWFETIVFSLIFISGISYFVFSISHIQKLAILTGDSRKYYEFFLLFFLVCLALVEFFKSLNFVSTGSIKPAVLLIYSYILLILGGTGVLALPGFNFKGEFLNFFDACFIASSSVCMTGLTPFPLAEYFNIKGQIVILFLQQFGAFGILSFAAFFATFIRKGVGIKQQIMINELVDSSSMSDSYKLLKRIFYLLMGIEIIGVSVMMLLWGDYPFSSFKQKLFFSAFHTVSSLTTGFNLFPSDQQNEIINSMFIWQWFVIFIMIIGGLGFPVIRDLFSPRRLRERVAMPWKQWELGTKISVYTTFVLLVSGAILYYFMTVNASYNERGLLEKITISFFQSANLRNTGMSVIELDTIPLPLILISMFFMFIGGGSSSLSGGIKTSTFVVVMISIIGIIRGKKEMTLGGRSIPSELIYKAFAIIVFSGNFILLIVTALTFTEHHIPFLKLVFEAVSAFTNTGLSYGVTSDLTNVGKILISIAMLGGRVGILTLGFALSSKSKPNTIHYPKTHLIIG